MHSKIETEVAQLKALIEEFGEDDTAKILQSFSCPRNSDVETFLTNPNKAIRFEKANNARTYLIFDANSNDLLAYFTLTFKELVLQGTEISKSEVRRMEGIDKNAERVRAYLIGQIGKNFAIEPNYIRLPDILEEIYSVISDAQDLIGGRIIVLDCEDNKRLIALYEDHGFRLIEMEGDDNPPLRTMYTHIVS